MLDKTASSVKVRIPTDSVVHMWIRRDLNIDITLHHILYLHDGINISNHILMGPCFPQILWSHNMLMLFSRSWELETAIVVYSQRWPELEKPRRQKNRMEPYPRLYPCGPEVPSQQVGGWSGLGTGVLSTPPGSSSGAQTTTGSWGRHRYAQWQGLSISRRIKIKKINT